ncbi:tyrosine-protein phosphatase OCA1 [Rhodotorula toruloides]|uniref:Putative tyrosine-protein phosphatase OCA1 n=1 Tax=Rhodotorula toruloides TaxID=5286 RepID=A0A511KJZ3_RHOTO|nr:tyrosine-protein phosphatase OCA1 [Rhodotorula toruloides]
MVVQEHSNRPTPALVPQTPSFPSSPTSPVSGPDPSTTSSSHRRTATNGQERETIACGRPIATSDGTRVAVCRVKPSKRSLIPPPNFGIVEEGLYRSSQPTEANFLFLDKLALRTVIWLAPEEANEPFREYIKDRNITLHHIAADEFAASYDPLSEETVLQALDLILDPTNSPILVCCGQGRHRTGTVIGCLRKLQHWALTATLEEYRRYAGPKVRVGNEQFIEQFDVDLIVVPPPPASSDTLSSA